MAQNLSLRARSDSGRVRKVAVMKSDFETFLETFPPESRETIRDVWNSLPRDLQKELELTLSAFAGLIRRNPASVADLLKLIARTAAPAVAPLHRLAIVGPVNVGKSTLFNALTPGSGNPAEVSSVPGTTRESQEQRTRVFTLVDTPGADHARDDEGEERERALRSAQESDFLLVVFDATRSITRGDQALFAELKLLSRPYVLLLNKVDRIDRREREHVVEAAGRSLGVRPLRVLPISAENGDGLDRLMLEIAALEPRLLGQLGTLLPAYRKKLCWQAIRRATIASTLIALTPIPLMDLIPLVAIQTSLVLTLARIYSQPLDWRRGRELITGLGAGVLARTLFGELSKFGGVPGWALSASIAGGTTLSIGAVVMRWFETGQRPDRSEVGKMASRFGRSVRERLVKFGKKKPTRESVTEALDDLLDEETEKFVEESMDPKKQVEPGS
jgi:small GTP-binding protein